MTVFHLDCRWTPREESAAACAERLAATLSGLVPLHPVFAHWYKQGWSRSAAEHPFCAMPPRVEELTKIFQRHPFTRGVPKDGFSLSAWNGHDSAHGIAVHIRVGTGFAHPVFPNDVSFRISGTQAANADLINAGVLEPAVLVCAAAWEPDYATVSAWGYGKRWVGIGSWTGFDPEAPTPQRAPTPTKYVPVESGWMTYLCPDYARRITPPPGIEAEPVAGGGLLLLATREVFTPGNPAHDSAADSIQEVLGPLQVLPELAQR